MDCFLSSAVNLIGTNGRIAATEFLCGHTGITSEVAFPGRGHFFQNREPERLRARLATLRPAARPGETME